jgi:hypothetical protein
MSLGDPDREDLRLLLDHYRTASPIVIPKVVEARAPWLTGTELDDLLQDVIRHPRYWSARELGIKLSLTEVGRSKYKIRTIAAVNVTDDGVGERRTVLDTTFLAALSLAETCKLHRAFCTQL